MKTNGAAPVRIRTWSLAAAALAAASVCHARTRLAGWREAVAAAEAGRRPLSVVCIGDSNTEMTTYAGALRSALQERFGERGVGYHSVGPRSEIPGAPRIERRGKWALSRVADDPKNPKPPRPWFAPDGIWASSDDPEASIAVTCAERCAVRLHYLVGPRQGTFAVRSGDATLAKVNARAPKAGYGIVELAASEFAVGDIRGEATIFGFDAQPDRAGGAVVHQLGAGWGTSADFAPIELESFRKFMKSVSPGLVTVMLGTNDMNNVRDPKAYEANMAMLLAKIRRAAPKATLLVFSCAEAGWTPSGLGRKHADVCRSLAARAGAVFVDVHAAAGPKASDWMARGLMREDNLHYTEAGGREVARLAFAALGFDPAKRRK